VTMEGTVQTKKY